MKTISLFILLFISGTLLAEIDNNNSTASHLPTYKQVTGKVTDRLTGENLAGVKIEIPETNIVVYSDFDGNFVLSLPAHISESSIQASFISYEESQLIPSNQNQSYLEIRMLPVTR